jgi:transposase
VLLKNEENLSDQEQQKLDLMYELSPALKSCHQLKEQFRQIFEQGKHGQITNPTQAELAFDEWQVNVRKNQLENLIKFWDTLNNWKPYILNYFLENYSGVTNGFVEGTNNKLKLIMRREFGFTNFDNFRLRIINHFSILVKG